MASWLGLLVAFGLALDLSAPARAASGSPLPVQEIAPGVFVYEAPVSLARPENEGAIANAGFVVGEDAVAVIDTGGSLAAGRRLLLAIRSRTSLPIRFVINTHVHPDHVLGNGAFVAEGATFVGHRTLPEALAAREARYLAANRELVGPAFEGTLVVPPTVLIDEPRDFELGQRRLRVEAWPTAHTNSDITVLDEATRTWFLGDLLFARHLPALDGKLRGWIETLGKLRARSVARVVPGHGPASLPWPAAALPIERYLAKLHADVAGMVREGRTMQEAGSRAAQSEAGSWTLFDEFNPRNGITAFQELEWE